MKFEMKHAVLKGIVALFVTIIIIATCARSDANGNEYSNAIVFNEVTTNSDNVVSKFVSSMGIQLALYSSSVIVETEDKFISIIKYDRFEASAVIRIINTSVNNTPGLNFLDPWRLYTEGHDGSFYSCVLTYGDYQIAIINNITYKFVAIVAYDT